MYFVASSFVIVLWNVIVCDVGSESKIKKHILIESLKYTPTNDNDS
jgi:hypothetical protein